MLGLSVCIPVFNYDVTKLVSDINLQCDEEQIEYEIVVVDDGSTKCKEENRGISAIPRVRYTELPQNIGRSAIRNRLVREARYDHLLFLDCDSAVVDNRFVANYIEAARQNEQADILVGGYAYREDTPFSLRIYYGLHREVRTACERNRQPYRSFSAFNFLAKKAALESIPFDESLCEYGHEDTLLGWQLKRHGYRLLHIDNPLCHLNYCGGEEFLKNTDSSVSNLWLIYHKIEDKKSFVEDVKLLQYLEFLKKFHLLKVASYAFNKFRPLFVENLLSTRPNLYIFDLYKLSILCSIASDEQKETNP